MTTNEVEVRNHIKAETPDKELREREWEFVSEIREYRRAFGISSADIARKLNVTRSYISALEGGAFRCRYELAIKVFNAIVEIVEEQKITWNKAIKNLIERLSTLED